MVPCIAFENFDFIFKTHSWGYSRECFGNPNSLYVYFFAIKKGNSLPQLPNGVYCLQNNSILLLFENNNKIIELKSFDNEPKTFIVDSSILTPKQIFTGKESVHLYGFFLEKQKWLIPTKIKY